MRLISELAPSRCRNWLVWGVDLRDFGVRFGGALLLFGAGLPVLADDLPPLRVSTLLGEPRRAALLFESDELNPPDLTLTRGLGDESAQRAAEERGSTPLDLPLGRGIGSRISIGETIAYDSNVFRLSGPAAAKSAQLARLGDWYSVTRLGLGLDKAYAGQQWVLDYDLSLARYGAFDFLNHNASTAVGRWRWTAGPEWNGELSAEHREAPDDFAYYRQQRRSLAVTRQLTGSAFYRLAPDWQVGVQAGQGSRRYPDGSRPGNEIDFAGVDTVLRYVPASGAVVAITRRRASGQYPNVPTSSGGQSESRFEQEELFADASLPIKSGTRALLRVGTVKRTYGRFPQNDYAGRNALAGLEWKLTPRTQLSGALRYDVEPAQDFVSSYVATKGLRLGALWEYSPKLRVEGRLEWRNADFRGDPGFGVRTGARREDRSVLAAVTGTWQISPGTRWITALTREQRESNEAGLSFNYWTLAGSLQWVF